LLNFISFSYLCHQHSTSKVQLKLKITLSKNNHNRTSLSIDVPTISTLNFAQIYLHSIPKTFNLPLIQSHFNPVENQSALFIRPQEKSEPSKMNTPGTGVSGYALLLTIQFVLLVIFGLYADYGDDLKPKNGTQAEEGFIIPKYARKSDWVLCIT
jgi:hypothetical protein